MYDRQTPSERSEAEGGAPTLQTSQRDDDNMLGRELLLLKAAAGFTQLGCHKNAHHVPCRDADHTIMSNPSTETGGAAALLYRESGAAQPKTRRLALGETPSSPVRLLTDMAMPKRWCLSGLLPSNLTVILIPKDDRSIERAVQDAKRPNYKNMLSKKKKPFHVGLV